MLVLVPSSMEDPNCTDTTSANGAFTLLSLLALWLS